MEAKSLSHSVTDLSTVTTPATDIPAVNALPSDWARFYAEQGFGLVPLVPKTKKPSGGKGWNAPERAFTDPDKAGKYWRKHPQAGMGAIHHQRTAVIDLDHLDYAQQCFEAWDIDLDRLLGEGCQTVGNPNNHGKLWFKIPDDLALSAHTLRWVNPDNREENITVFELRTGSEQDVLPPSIHPDTGKPYTWKNPPWEKGGLPDLPPVLRQLWTQWETYEAWVANLSPWWIPPKATPIRSNTSVNSADNQAVVTAFNDTHSLTEILEQHGYQRKGKRYICPSEAGQYPPGVILFENESKCYSHHGSDSLADGKAHDAFDCVRVLDHGSDWKEALRTVAEQLEMDHKSKKKQPTSSKSTHRSIDIPVEKETGKGKSKDLYRSEPVRIIGGEICEQVKITEEQLSKKGACIYQRTGNLVRVVTCKPETVKGIQRPGGKSIIMPIDSEYLLYKMNRHMNWESWNERQKDWKNCNAPRQVANMLLSLRGEWSFKPLTGIISAPTLRPDGTVIDQPGYDLNTGLLFVNKGIFPNIPESPSYKAGQAALRYIEDEVLSGFSFAQPHDKSAAFSAILTGVCRQSLKSAPMHTIDAPIAGSGKSLLADVVSLIATGTPSTVMAYSDDPEEMRKRLLSVLMSGDAVVNLDNIESILHGDALCSVLTQETFTDRILGTNRTATAPTICTWLATGNNLAVSGDMTRRVIPIHLDPECENPEDRQFERNLYEWIPVNRGKLVVAALTALRAYIVAGKPKQAISNYGSFEEWSDLIRSALVWLGEPDPNIGRADVEDADPVRIKLRTLLLGWYRAFKTDFTESSTAVASQYKNPELHRALSEYCSRENGSVTARRIGNTIRTLVRRVECGARFMSYKSGTRTWWRVEVVDKTRFEQFLHRVAAENYPPPTTPPSDPLATATPHPKPDQHVEKDSKTIKNIKSHCYDNATLPDAELPPLDAYNESPPTSPGSGALSQQAQGAKDSPLTSDIAIQPPALTEEQRTVLSILPHSGNGLPPSEIIRQGRINERSTETALLKLLQLGLASKVNGCWLRSDQPATH